jgi:Tol biopolymer transport system component
MVFASMNAAMNIWSLDANIDQGTVAGEPRQLTWEQTGKWGPFISRDGSRLAFVSFAGLHTSRSEIRIRDLRSNRESAVLPKEGSVLGSFGNPVLSADGSLLAYRDKASRGVGAYLASPGGSPVSGREICANCLVRDFFSNRDYALVQYGPNVIVRLNLVTGDRTPVLDSGANGLNAASLSQDDRWLAFALGRPDGNAAIYAAPVRDHPISEKEWVLIIQDNHFLGSPRWSPNGSLLYYLSERDGPCAIWAQRFETASGKPVGTAFRVFHPNRVRFGMNMPVGNAALGVAAGRLFFYMVEGSGNIFMTHLQSH